MFGWLKKKVYRAQEFVLEDKNGNIRARLTNDAVGNALLCFNDDNNRTRLFVGVTPDGTPRLGLNYANGKGSVQIEASDMLNSSGLVVTGPSGKVQILLGIAKNGLPAIALFDQEGNLLFPVASGKKASAPDDISHWSEGLGDFNWDDILDQ